MVIFFLLITQMWNLCLCAWRLPFTACCSGCQKASSPSTSALAETDAWVCSWPGVVLNGNIFKGRVPEQVVSKEGWSFIRVVFHQELYCITTTPNLVTLKSRGWPTGPKPTGPNPTRFKPAWSNLTLPNQVYLAVLFDLIHSIARCISLPPPPLSLSHTHHTYIHTCACTHTQAHTHKDRLSLFQ